MRFVKKMKVKVMGCMVTAAAVGASGCTNAALGLHDYQRDLLFGFGSLAVALLMPGTPGPAGPAGPQGPEGPAGADAEAGQGAPGEPGEAGLSCWDLNGNFIADPEEDINGDGVWDALDCQGAPGEDGDRGPTGPAGADGEDGTDGLNGLDGQPGATFFDMFIDDFFTIKSSYVPTGSLPTVVAFEEPMIKLHDGMWYDLETQGTAPIVAFRAAIPTTYDAGNQVTLRLFLFSTQVDEADYNCGVLRLDVRRLKDGTDVMPYTSGDGGDDGARYITLSGGHEEMVVIDLPLNSVNGLNFENDLEAGDFLAFEFNGLLDLLEGGDLNPILNGTEYTFLGAELYESAAGDAYPAGTVITDRETLLLDGPPCLSDPVQY